MEICFILEQRPVWRVLSIQTRNHCWKTLVAYTKNTYRDYRKHKSEWAVDNMFFAFRLLCTKIEGSLVSAGEDSINQCNAMQDRWARLAGELLLNDSRCILRIKISAIPYGVADILVREMGLEPTRRNHTHLKRACLPFQHSRKWLEYYNCALWVCQPLFPQI